MVISIYHHYIQYVIDMICLRKQSRTGVNLFLLYTERHRKRQKLQYFYLLLHFEYWNFTWQSKVLLLKLAFPLLHRVYWTVLWAVKFLLLVPSNISIMKPGAQTMTTWLLSSSINRLRLKPIKFISRACSAALITFPDSLCSWNYFSVCHDDWVGNCGIARNDRVCRDAERR